MKKLLLSTLMLLFSICGFAYDCEVDGIYYNLNTTDYTASVTHRYGSYPYADYSGVVHIPAEVAYNGTTYNVTSVGDTAFYSCSGLTELTIGNSVISIGDDAFSSCSGLTGQLAIPNSVTSIGNSAFYECPQLTHVVIEDGETELNLNNAFSGTPITSVYLGRNISEKSFYGKITLQELTIGNLVTEIGNSAFWNCSGLTELTIPNSVTSIGSYAFYDCIGLTELTIGNSVTSIGAQAFLGCSGLTELIIPNSVTSIGGSAFHGCTSLTSVTSLNTTPPTIYSSTFSETTEQNATLHVLAGYKAVYQQAEYWENFYNIQEDVLSDEDSDNSGDDPDDGGDNNTDGIDTLHVNKDSKDVIYTINGVKVSTTNVSDLSNGIYIVNGKKVVVK